MKIKSLIVGGLLLSGLFIVSCNDTDDNGTKLNSPELDSKVSLNIVEDDVLADEIMEDVIEEAEEVTSMQYSGTKTESDTTDNTGEETDVKKCRERTVTWMGDGTIKIEMEYFGECRENQKRIRNGKIIMVLGGNWWKREFTRTITFENYSINGNKIEGTKIIKQVQDTTEGAGTPENPKVVSELTYDIKITKENGDIIEREGKRIRSVIGGEENKWFCWTSKFQIEGYSNNYKKLINEGDTTEYDIRMDIIKPLVKTVMWPFYIEGTKQLVINSQDTVIIDYGEGELDAIVTTTTKDTTIVKDLWKVCWGKRQH